VAGDACHSSSFVCKDRATISDGPAFCPPPTDPKLAAVARRKYHRTLLDRVSADIANLGAGDATIAGGRPSP
jgi:hypothetical protein